MGEQVINDDLLAIVIVHLGRNLEISVIWPSHQEAK